jgi:glycosyltransferase involved in cell wall biosynthesis
MKPPATTKVSVIIPCRNERDGVEGCLHSICAQQEPFGGFEVVVADGMSTDGTRDLLNQFAAHAPRLLAGRLRRGRSGDLRRSGGALRAAMK